MDTKKTHEELRREAEEGFRAILNYIGENPERDGLLETPARYVRALLEMTSGTHTNPASLLEKSFEMVPPYRGMVISRDIEFSSLCEHHVLPFWGKAHLAYIPRNGRSVVGLSKLARLVECLSKRLQVQERMTSQIADIIEAELRPKGVAIVIEGTHSCQCWRGVKKNGVMVTSEIRGAFRKKATREELMALIRS